MHMLETASFIYHYSKTKHAQISIHCMYDSLVFVSVKPDWIMLMRLTLGGYCGGRGLKPGVLVDRNVYGTLS